MDTDKSRTSETDKICQATRADGQRCTVRALADGFCFSHSPSTEDKRREARSQGGQNKGTPARADRLLPRDLRPVMGALIRALTEVHDGTITPQQGSAMSAIAASIIKVMGVVELEARISQIEHDLAEDPHRDIQNTR